MHPLLQIPGYSTTWKHSRNWLRKTTRCQYKRCIRNMGVSALDLDPASEMQRTAMKHIQILCWQIVNSEQEERANPDKCHMLTNPPRVIVQCILHTRIHTQAPVLQKQHTLVSSLYKLMGTALIQSIQHLLNY